MEIVIVYEKNQEGAEAIKSFCDLSFALKDCSIVQSKRTNHLGDSIAVGAADLGISPVIFKEKIQERFPEYNLFLTAEGKMIYTE